MLLYKQKLFFQFLISILLTDLLMSLVVIPMNVFDRFVNPKIDADFVVSCKIQLFSHLFAITTRGWSIAAFILLHHLR